jgi:N-acetylated-alpha-linked acidic dipeptidase
LRLSSSIILPINTTHYAYEVEEYLDKYVVYFWCTIIDIPELSLVRVEDIAAASSLDLDLTPLRKAIHTLQKTSIDLDVEKHKAEIKLRHAIKKLKKRHGNLRKLKGTARKVICRLKNIFGHECKRESCLDDGRLSKKPLTITRDNGMRLTPRIGRYPAWRKEQQEREEYESAYGFALEAGLVDDFPLLDSHSELRPSRSCGLCKLKRAVKRVQAVNRKLVAFERGFISEDGIKDR